MKKARIITIANQKGGVGKTTTVMNLAHALTKQGKKVLVVDSDPQANLTSYLNAQPNHTLDELYLAKKLLGPAHLGAFITPTPSGVSIIACDSGLSGVEYYLFSRPQRETILAGYLEMLAPDFDFILIDTPPSINLLTVNALTACDEVLIPVQPEFFSLEGLVKIQETVEDVRTRWNPRLQIGGVLITQANQRRKLTQEVVKSLKKDLGTIVFDTIIREGSAISESSGHGKSVLDYAPKSAGAIDYFHFSQEVLNQTH